LRGGAARNNHEDDEGKRRISHDVGSIDRQVAEVIHDRLPLLDLVGRTRHLISWIAPAMEADAARLTELAGHPAWR